MVLSSFSGFRVDLSYSLRDPLKDPQFNLLGPPHNFLSHNGPVSVFPTHDVTFQSLPGKLKTVRNITLSISEWNDCSLCMCMSSTLSYSHDSLKTVIQSFINKASFIHPSIHPSCVSCLFSPSFRSQWMIFLESSFSSVHSPQNSS